MVIDTVVMEYLMKKILAVVLGTTLTLSLAACDGPYDDRRDNNRHHHHHGDRGYGQNMGGQGMGSQSMGNQGRGGMGGGMNGGPGGQGGW